MYVESMALTGDVDICLICKEFLNYLGIYSLGDPFTGSWCAGWLFYCPPVINQHRWETLPEWLPVNSLYLGSAQDNTRQSRVSAYWRSPRPLTT